MLFKNSSAKILTIEGDKMGFVNAIKRFEEVAGRFID